MSGYYPSHAGSHRSHSRHDYGHSHGSSHGYEHTGGGHHLYVPSHSGSHYGHHERSRSRSRHRDHEPSHAVIATVPSSHHGGHHHHNHHHMSLGRRFKRFFGFDHAYPSHVKHQGKNSSWGFLGFSRRRRYVDAYTGGEVDKRGRPVYRV